MTTPRDEIEAARARGYSIEETARRLRAPARVVKAVWDAQDALNDAEPPTLPVKKRHGERRVCDHCGSPYISYGPAPRDVIDELVEALNGDYQRKRGVA